MPVSSPGRAAATAACSSGPSATSAAAPARHALDVHARAAGVLDRAHDDAVAARVEQRQRGGLQALGAVVGVEALEADALQRDAHIACAPARPARRAPRRAARRAPGAPACRPRTRRGRPPGRPRAARSARGARAASRPRPTAPARAPPPRSRWRRARAGGRRSLRVASSSLEGDVVGVVVVRAVRLAGDGRHGDVDLDLARVARRRERLSSRSRWAAAT